jgi:DNA-binding transcriptional regulator YdaS (Cro superfamily)
MDEREDGTQKSNNLQPARLLLRPNHIDDEQKRQADRTGARREVAVRLAGGASAMARLVNVSPTGLQLSLTCDVAPGTALEVETLPGEMLGAVVRWSRKEKTHHLIGAEWHEPLPFDHVWKIRAFG